MKGFLIKKITFYSTPFILVFILGVLYLTNYYLQSEIRRLKVNKIPFVVNPRPYPLIKTVLGTSVTIPSHISAQSAIIVDDDSQVVLFSKNPTLSLSMASTTKIMTALTALEYYKKDDILIMQTENVEGAVVGFKKNDKVTFENVLYGLLLPSGNDAALSIARNYPGGQQAFVSKMNDNAKKYNLQNTHYGDPQGLNDEEDYSTVTDLVRLASIAIKNSEFKKIVETKSWTINVINSSDTYFVSNLNKLLGSNGITGIKTGYTEEAGEVLVTSKLENGHTLIIVVMKSKDRFGDTRKLLNLIEGNLIYLSTLL